MLDPEGGLPEGTRAGSGSGSPRLCGLGRAPTGLAAPPRGRPAALRACRSRPRRRPRRSAGPCRCRRGGGESDHAVGAIGESDSMNDDEVSTATRPQLAEFVSFCEQRTGMTFRGPGDFDAFCVAAYRDFWKLFLA